MNEIPTTPQKTDVRRIIRWVGLIIVILFFAYSMFQEGLWSLVKRQPPWGDRPSIYNHIRAHIQPGKTGLREGGEDLPDEEEYHRVHGELRYAPGGWDGILSYHLGADETEKVHEEIYTLLTQALRKRSGENIQRLYDFMKEQTTLTYVDSLLEAVVQRKSGMDADRFHDLALWIATKGADREPVKAAIAMLGILEGYDDQDVIVALGRHDEFSLFCSVAIANLVEEPDLILWEMAKNADGWGRIHIVERLAETPKDPIKAWLLREGFRNQIMYEYLAYPCAVAGQLHKELAKPEIDDALFTGASEILEALITGRGGPVEGIDDYEFAHEALDHLLRHGKTKATSLTHFNSLHTIKQFLSSNGDAWKERVATGWTAQKRKAQLAQVNALLTKPEWKSMAQHDLSSKDEQVFFTAVAAARNLGMDVWPEFYARTQAGESYWYYLMETEDIQRIKQAVALAEERLPLDRIATGPDTKLGMGEEFEAHNALDSVVRGLRDHPGIGWLLVKTGLQSPVIRNRNLSITALETWGKGNWSAEAEGLLKKCMEIEPDEEVKKRLEALVG